MNHSELLLRDVTALHAAHTAGTWRPLPAEIVLADRLAPAQWSAPLLQAALRDSAPEVAGGSLGRVLETAASVLEDPSVADRPHLNESLVQLRLLIDAMSVDTAAPLSCPP